MGEHQFRGLRESYETAFCHAAADNEPIAFPAQHQNPPGFEHLMNPRPIFDYPGYVGSGKLKGKVAIITGGDSGFGRAIAVAFAKEGANLTIFLYLNEHRDAEETKEYVEKLGANCQLLPGDLRDPSTSKSAVAYTMKTYQQLDIVVNNAAVQPYTRDIMDVSDEQLENNSALSLSTFLYDKGCIASFKIWQLYN